MEWNFKLKLEILTLQMEMKSTIYTEREEKRRKNRQASENVDQFIGSPYFQHDLDNIGSLLEMNLMHLIPSQSHDIAFCGGRKEQEQEEGLSMTMLYRRKEVRLKSYSTEELNIYQQSCLLISLKFAKGKDMQRRKTCILFMWKGKMYSPSALLQKLKGLVEINQTIYVISFSETDGYLYMEFLKCVSKELAILIAKELNNYNDSEKIRLADILLLFERIEMFVLNQWLRQYINPEDSMTRLETDLDFNDNSSHIQKNVINSNQENYSLPPDRKKSPEQINNINSNTERERHITTGFNTQWTVRSKMKNTKVRTQSNPVRELKVYLQSVEVDFGGLVNEYFGDNMIRQAVYGAFRQDFDCRSKTSFDRPTVPWPSMHPLLPYKLRFLDEDEETSHWHRNQEQYNEIQNELNTENRDNYSSDGGTDQYGSCTSECTDEIYNDIDQDDD